MVTAFVLRYDLPFRHAKKSALAHIPSEHFSPNVLLSSGPEQDGQADAPAVIDLEDVLHHMRMSQL